MDWQKFYEESAWTRREVEAIRRLSRVVGLRIAEEIQIWRSGNATRSGWARRWED